MIIAFCQIINRYI